MILKASQRGGSKQLALHLLKTEENEHVHVHELRGFMAEDLQSAFQEIHAISRGTRARQFLFSLSMNPPQQENVPDHVFETAIEDIEQKLGLDGQPRAVVFHEKEGRRHAHVVWSRIDTEKMKAINLPHYKLKLRDIAKELYLENGWQMPRGFVDRLERDPATFTLSEWQQAKRGGHDPKALKRMFQECWAMADSRDSFAQALKERGYILARGDRRGFVAVDFRGEVYAVGKYSGMKAKEVKEHLGDEKELPSVDQVKQANAARMTTMLRQHIQTLEERQKRESRILQQRRKETVQKQREQRDQLHKAQQARWQKESHDRARRFSTGMRGLWDWMTGKSAKTRNYNEQEALLNRQRDRAERERMIFKQLEDRRLLHQEIQRLKQEHTKQIAELHRDIAEYHDRSASSAADLMGHFKQARKGLGKASSNKRDLGLELAPDY